MLSFSNNTAATLLPTSKYLFDLLMQDIKFSRHTKFNELVRIYAVSRFELLNLLIKESFYTCRLEELETETIKLLSASVQLHLILTGKRQDLGHPDEAGVIYTILESIVRGTKGEARTFKTGSLEKLIQSEERYYLLKKVTKENSTIFFLKSLFSDLNQENPLVNKEIITQQLLPIVKSIDLAIYRGHYPKSDLLFVPFKNLGTPKGKQHGVNISLTDYETGKWPYELPKPSFLKQSQASTETNNLPCMENKYSMHGNIPLTSNPESSKAETPSAKAPVKLEQQAQVPEEAKELQKETPIYPDLHKGEIAKEKLTTFVQSPHFQQEGLQEKTNEIVLAPTTHPIMISSSSSLTSPFSFTRDWVLPTGLRSFHKQMLAMPYDIRQLNSTHQPIVDQLFNPQQQCNVSFKDFKSLWEAADGSITNNHNGSHRELIGPRQESLFGIFAHGNNQTYGKRYIKYLQTAVLYVGMRPSQGLEQANK